MFKRWTFLFLKEVCYLKIILKLFPPLRSQDFSSIKENTTILINAATIDGAFIQLPEATTSNSGLHIKLIYGVAPAARITLDF